MVSKEGFDSIIQLVSKEQFNNRIQLGSKKKFDNNIQLVSKEEFDNRIQLVLKGELDNTIQSVQSSPSSLICQSLNAVNCFRIYISWSVLQSSDLGAAHNYISSDLNNKIQLSHILFWP